MPCTAHYFAALAYGTRASAKISRHSAGPGGPARGCTLNCATIPLRQTARGWAGCLKIREEGFAEGQKRQMHTKHWLILMPGYALHAPGTRVSAPRPVAGERRSSSADRFARPFQFRPRGASRPVSSACPGSLGFDRVPVRRVRPLADQRRPVPPVQPRLLD